MTGAEPLIGDIVGDKYVLEGLIGRGGMGAVYRARHRITDRVVALKWLLEDDPHRRARFLREARAMGVLSHPNVVGVLDVGDHEGAIFLVMDYLEGKSLRELLEERQKYSPEEAIRILMPALCGVAAAHQAGILHRDLKPENLFALCDDDGAPFDTKVLDFGVAKPTDEAGSSTLTNTGAIVGTPRYMAPEQLREEALDERADIYALGLILFELMTGQLPYKASAFNALLLEIMTCDVGSPRDLVPEIPEGLANVVLKALTRDRDARFADVASFARALEPWGGGARFNEPRQAHTPKSRRPVKPLVQTRPADSIASAPTKPAVPLVSSVELTQDPPKPPRSKLPLMIAGATVFVALAILVVVFSHDWSPAEVPPVAAHPPAPAQQSDPEPVPEADPIPTGVEAPVIEAPVAPPPSEPVAQEAPPHPAPQRSGHRRHVEAPPPDNSPPTSRRVESRAGTLTQDDF